MPRSPRLRRLWNGFVPFGAGWSGWAFPPNPPVPGPVPPTWPMRGGGNQPRTTGHATTINGNKNKKPPLSRGRTVGLARTISRGRRRRTTAGTRTPALGFREGLLLVTPRKPMQTDNDEQVRRHRTEGRIVVVGATVVCEHSVVLRAVGGRGCCAVLCCVVLTQ